MSGQCAGIKRDGGRCTAIVNGHSDYCYQHDPNRSHERRRNAQRAGRSSGTSEVRDLRRQLEDLTRRVVDGSLESGRGAVAAQLINTRIRLLEYARRTKETEELENRIADLERRTFGRTG